MKKTAQIHLYFTLKTIEILFLKAEDLGLTVSQYVKYIVMKDIEAELKEIKKLKTKEKKIPSKHA